MKWEEIILSALRNNDDIDLAIKKAMRIAPGKISAILENLLRGKITLEKKHVYPKIISLLYFHLLAINRDFISNSSLYNQKIPRNPAEAYLEAVSISKELHEISLQAKYLFMAADYYYEHQEFNTSEKLLKESITLYKTLEEGNRGEYSHALVSCYNNLGNVYHKRGEYSQAIQSYETALTLLEELAIKDPMSYRLLIAQITCNIGNIFFGKNEFIMAEQFYEKALNLLEELSAKNPGAYEFFIAAILNNLGNISMKTGKFTSAEKIYIRAIERIRTLPQKEQVKYNCELAGFLNSLGNAYKYRRQFDKAITNYQEALVLFEELAKLDPGRYRPQISGILNNLGNIYKNINQFTKAEEYYKNALEIRRELANTHAEPLTRDVSDTLDNLGDLYLRIREFRKAECALKEALEIRKTYENKNPEIYNLLIAQTLNKLGTLYYKIGNFNQSEHALLEALAINRQLVEKNPDVYILDCAQTLNNLLNLYKETHNFSSAKNISSEVLHLKEDLLHSDMDAYGYDFANTLNNLGNLSAYLRNFHDAEETYLRALHIARKLCKKYPHAYIPFVADILNNLGNVYRDCKKFSQSENAYLETLEIRRELAKREAGAYMFSVSETLNNLGSLYFESGKYFEAEHAFKEALDIRKILGDKFPAAYTHHIAHAYTHLGNLYLRTERLPEAESAFKDSLNIYDRLFEGNPDAFTVALSTAHNNLGNFYFHSKNFLKAKDHYEKAYDIIQGLESKKLDIYDFYIGRIFNNLGNIHLELDNASEAEKYYNKAIEKDIKTASWFDMAKTTHNISKVHSSVESLEKARTILELAILFSKEEKYTYMQKGEHEKIYLDLLEKGLDCYTVLETLRDPNFLSLPWETIISDEELEKAQNESTYQKTLMNTLLEQKLIAPEIHIDLPEKSCFIYLQMVQGHIHLFLLKNDTIEKYKCEDQFFSIGNTLSYMLHLQQYYIQNRKDVTSLVNKFHDVSRGWIQALPGDIINIMEISNHLLFSADQVCSFLPLETLVLNEQPICLEKIVVRAPSFHHIRNLLDKKPCFDSPLIIENPWPEINKTSKHYAGPSDDKEYTLTYLDGAHEETETLSGIFSNATILSEHEATGQAFISELSKHSLIHFCGHGSQGRILFLSGPFKGIPPPYEPEEFTDLRKTERKEATRKISMMEEWHPVTDVEIFNTPVREGTIIFLNACETGQHKYAGGGHFQGLSSVLLKNGAHSVISSLFPVFDHTSSDFATHFYQELLQTHSVCKSLQEARIHIKNNYQSQIYWIPYIHYGSPF